MTLAVDIGNETDENVRMNFVNLTPHPASVLDDAGRVIKQVRPSGRVGLAIGEPASLQNVPPPAEGTAYIVLPALVEASDRPDLLRVEPEQAQRGRRGNVESHVCYWHGDPTA